MKNLSNQKGITQILTILIIVAGLVVGVYLVGQATNLFPKAAGPKPQYIPVNKAIEQITGLVPPISTKEDLLNRLQDLENTNLDELNRGINENNSDAAAF
ncbi:hypothetical protein A3F00_00015 [Candidatus Daviesbacteria bacterium RIFCSPHIGHO2_12_FULL_37_11]|uniref:Uncharacterized protein n=1 Tax=Candidatus Daviesbacteria bacterium RIFCSPHIGHO2_12_FULL_37_11 TaxID=1797777 RepID=A0A1F5KBR3_9BACT|nr:MAG: hypothetical protein A2111_00280 [Candidatus Daviesbacteria bacterium GWA1_38_6]OGE18335.1 MAG: hypothetical protein A2769_01460 [Candidatus Daviesbacteria bacterium RIFCSPHIGHO2_01_FULL_37_27]OGE38387.1 MAG: hypothetical protein A3F00_00015 [Candidatus Daviesbacteria bacterium RIFCSPHIGHO2_12_FULL_37_11]